MQCIARRVRPLEALRVDGGAAVNDLLMQFQADVLGVPVVRPRVTETTALGAAYLAGLATGFWPSPEALRAERKGDVRFEPQDGRWRAGRAAGAVAEGGGAGEGVDGVEQVALYSGFERARLCGTAKDSYGVLFCIRARAGNPPSGWVARRKCYEKIGAFSPWGKLFKRLREFTQPVLVLSMEPVANLR